MSNKVTVLLPGGFKPPTAGHLQLANAYAEQSNVEKVLVLIGPTERDGITREQSMAIWNILPKNKKIELVKTSVESPMVASFEYVFSQPKNSKETFAMGASSKGDDAKRSDIFVKTLEGYKNKPTKDGKMAPKGVSAIKLPMDVTPLKYKGRKDDNNGKGISASILRSDLENNDKALFATNYPDLDQKLIDKIWGILKGNKAAKKLEEMAIFSSLIRRLLTEGGAAGHMWHIFDIPDVKTGKDLVKKFEQSADFVTKNPVPVKIDGINASIRLADYGGKRQFVLDRGSNKPLDVKGVTKDDLKNRFEPGHGMIGIGSKVLDIFNQSLKSRETQAALDKLGLIENPNILLNIEYVEGKSNVQEYENNFLAIHNLLEIDRVSPTKRQTQELPYNDADLQELIKSIQPIAKKSGFEVMGMIPAQAKTKPNLNSTLNKSYSIVPTKGKKETKSLSQWLASANNTKGQKIKLKDGKTVDALSKQVFLAVKNGTPIDELVENPKDAKLAIDSWAIYQASVVLGDAILEVTDTPLGAASTQEGIVIRDKNISPKPVKITGSFIERGMQSSFQK